jgi:transcriptional regulator with XRE-family HTH domain
MSKRNVLLAEFLTDLTKKHHIAASRLAAELGVSHATISRWLSGLDIPSPRSCQKLADFSGVPSEKILSMAGHLPVLTASAPAEWPEFREYAQRKYGKELDEDLVVMIEGLIERRRKRRTSGKTSQSNSAM